MNFVVRDGYTHAVEVIRYIVNIPRFSRMTISCRKQVSSYDYCEALTLNHDSCFGCFIVW
jgi:hypothetical protein